MVEPDLATSCLLIGSATMLRPRYGRTAMTKTKVSAEDIVTLSKKEGFLAKQLYVVFTTQTKGIEPVMKVVKEHLEFQVALEKKGIMFAAEGDAPH
jgi:hypothetical protein